MNNHGDRKPLYIKLHYKSFLKAGETVKRPGEVG